MGIDPSRPFVISKATGVSAGLLAVVLAAAAPLYARLATVEDRVKTHLADPAIHHAMRGEVMAEMAAKFADLRADIRTKVDRAEFESRSGQMAKRLDRIERGMDEIKKLLIEMRDRR
ncbi:MAG: hypothetical protein ACPHCN_14370 [Mycobacterium sp.]